MNLVTVVLHRPIYPRNVGMCARAMANMGINNLVVIGPHFELSHDEAKQGAAHAQEILKNARVYSTQKEFLGVDGDGVRIALSGKDSRLKKPDSLDLILKDIASDKDHPVLTSKTPLYFFFGPEDDGLSSEEMELCNHVCKLPTWGEITSLNLSHAVLLTLYIARSHLGHTDAFQETTQTATSAVPAYYPGETIKRWLEALGFDLSARRVNIEKTLNRIFLSRSPTNEELRVIDTVLQQTVRRLNDK